MRLPVLLLALAGALSPAVPAHAQEVAGRVILATGNVTVVRGAQKLPATVGVPLRAGDTLTLGAQSHAQLHLTDDSIISLRPETTFRIREYAFEGKDPAQQRSFFDLVKGGMRTVTGLIRGRDNYRVTTETVSIGIRGTHYWLVSCNQDCRNADGSLGEDGDYGLVREGSVAITAAGTKTGSVFGTDQIMHVASEPQVQREFSSDQVFRVARNTGQIQELIGPPSFLFAPIGGIGATKPPVTPPAPRQDTATTVALTGQRGDMAGDTRVTSTVTNNTNFTFLNVKQQSATVAPSTDPVLLATSAFNVQGPASVLQPTTTGTVFYRLQGPFSLQTTGCSGSPCDILVNGDITLGVNLTLQLAYIRINAVNNHGEKINFGNPAATAFPIVVSGNQVTFSGSFKFSDFPQNNGSFRCSNCGPNGSLGFADTISASGTITGSTATVTLSATDAGGGGSVMATLGLQTPPNSLAAAMVMREQDGARTAFGAGYWDVDVDAAGRLTRLNNGGTVPGGLRNAALGSAVNNSPAGHSAPAFGNLVWGTWDGSGAQMTDFDYIPVTTLPSNVRQPWITGTITNTLPTTLGSVTYTPLSNAIVINNGTNTGGVLNSALLTANFVDRRIDISINATNTSNSRTFQMNGSTNISAVSARFGAGFTSVTCTIGGSPCSGGPFGGNYNGFIAGANAEGAGVAFQGGGGSGGVSGAIPFKR